jgi:hypothetical protein
MAAWTKLDETAALGEGWCLFGSTNKKEAAWQLGHMGAPGSPFKQDEDAWVHVRTRAGEGSTLHMRAMTFLQHVSPSEHATIIAYVPKTQDKAAPKKVPEPTTVKANPVKVKALKVKIRVKKATKPVKQATKPVKQAGKRGRKK